MGYSCRARRDVKSVVRQRCDLRFIALLITLIFAGARVASAQTPVPVMPLGDSITQGVNDTLPPGGYPGYRAPLWDQLVSGGFNVDFVGSLADGPASIDRNHEGHGGFRIDQILANINAYLTAAGPDVILLHIGTNDLLQGASVDLTTQRLAQLMDRIHELRPTAHLIVTSVISVRTPNVFNADPQLFAQYAANVAGLVGDRAALGWRISHLDMATLVGLTQSEWDSNGVHPNDTGYGKMAGVWYPELAAMLDGDAPPTVGLTFPFDMSSVSGQITLSASAFDDVFVNDVAFAVDGVPIFTDSSAPYETTWDSTSVPNGAHSLRVTARDSAGQTRVQVIRFTTVNPLSNTALVAEFGFEESDGPTTFDGSGRGNHAALVGIQRTALGHSGNALQFNGSSGRMEIKAPAADFRFTTAFTVSTWVNPATLPTGWHVIAARQIGAATTDSWFLGHNGPTLYFAAGAVVSTTLTAGQWTHIAAVKSGTTVAIYLNGTLAASTNTAESPLATDANEVGIGAGNNGNPLWGEFFNGRLDDLRFYAEARSVPQILADMSTSVGFVPDTVPPVISSVAAAASDGTVTITWKTDEATSSQVEFGSTSNYGTTTPLDSTLVVNHMVTISGLALNTLYHYRVISRDASLNEGSSNDATFRTTAGPATLIAAYGFEEASGATAVDSAGDDNPGTLLNGVARTDGRFGQGLSFDGANDRVTVGNTAALNPGTAPFTASVWIRTTASTVQRVMGKRAVCNSGNNAFWNLHVFQGTGVMAAEVSDAAGNYEGIIGSRVINDGLWHFVTVVRNDVSLQVYVDGELDVSGATSVPVNITNTAAMEIGTLCNAAPFNGQMDEARYYAGALSPGQIQASMATGVVLDTPPSTLVAAYNFDAGSGSTVTDQSGWGHTLTLTNATWAQGHTSSALLFNGTSSRAELPANIATQLGFTTAFTISVWVNPSALPTSWHAIAARQLGTGSNDSWFLGHNGTTLYFAAGATVTTTLTVNQWTHIAAVKNGTTIAIYKNGALAASLTTATSPLPTDANEVGIGAGNNGDPLWGDFFKGRIDDLRFYAEARSLSQIQTDMNNSVGAAPDIIPPVISGVAAAAADGTATITWNTDEPSTSLVEFGLDGNYGTLTPVDPALMTSHTVTLSGLSLNTLYHYRVRSADASFNERVSGDGMFTTTAAAATAIVAFGFEEVSGPTAVDSAGDDDPGTLLNGVARTQGRYGKGLSFDGVNDRVTVADAARLNPGAGAFSVGVWMRTSATTLSRIVGKRSVCTSAGSFWNLHLLQGSGVVAGEVSDSAGNYVGIIGTRVINDGLWHYLTLVRNGTAVQIYVDGVLEVAGTAPQPADVNNTAPLEIGTLCGQAPFNGQMDEVRYYGGALSPNQIQAAMGNGVVVTPSALVAAYSFDAGSGTTVADLSGRGNTLVLTNTTWTTQGHTNGALQFDGSSSRAELPAPATDLAFSSAFTITAWVRPTTLPSGWHVISARQRGTTSDDSWFLGHSGTTLYFAAGATVTTSLAAGQWTHVAAVKNGTTVALYKNGVLAASTTTATGALVSDANEVGIGAGNNGNPLWGEVFNGRIDDLRFYNEARTVEQIQGDMTIAVAPPPDGVPPTISNVVAAAAHGTATITWNTDEPSTSLVEFGLDGNYGTFTTVDPALVTSHTVTLSGLSLNTLYHYRVRSADANFNERVSGDGTFMTTAGPATLVVAYGFEEATGTTTAVDSAGADSPGTLVNGVGRSAGRYGQGLSFDGVNDRVTAANAAALNPGTGAFTASIWVKTTGTATQRVIGKRAVCSGGTAFWNMHLLQGTGVVAAEVNDVAGHYLGIIGSRPANDGQWHHLALVRNDVTVQVYVDGVLDVSGTSPVPVNVDNTAVLEIGTLCNAVPFAGQLDEVRYYNGALNPSQIQAIMASAIVNQTTLVAVYNFDAGSGPIASDQSGRGNTLALTNTAWSVQGHTNGALQFNGTTSRAELPTPATDLAFTTAFTLSAWVNAATLGSGWHVIAARQIGAASTDTWFLGHNGTTLYFAAGATVSSSALVAGQWAHVAGVKDGSALALYVNGALVASTTSATSPIPTDDNEVGIGAGNNGNPLWGEVLNGRIDDLRFYEGAQSLEQIQTDMALPVS